MDFHGRPAAFIQQLLINLTCRRYKIKGAAWSDSRFCHLRDAMVEIYQESKTNVECDESGKELLLALYVL